MSYQSILHFNSTQHSTFNKNNKIGKKIQSQNLKTTMYWNCQALGPGLVFV